MIVVGSELRAATSRERLGVFATRSPVRHLADSILGFSGTDLRDDATMPLREFRRQRLELRGHLAQANLDRSAHKPMFGLCECLS